MGGIIYGRKPNIITKSHLNGFRYSMGIGNYKKVLYSMIVNSNIGFWYSINIDTVTIIVYYFLIRINPIGNKKYNIKYIFGIIITIIFIFLVNTDNVAPNIKIIIFMIVGTLLYSVKTKYINRY